MIKKLLIAFALLMGGASLAHAGEIKVGGIAFTPGEYLTIAFSGLPGSPGYKAIIQSGDEGAIQPLKAHLASDGTVTILTSDSQVWLKITSVGVITDGLMKFHLPNGLLALGSATAPSFVVSGNNVVPEPGVLLLIGIGFLSVFLFARRREGLVNGMVSLVGRARFRSPLLMAVVVYKE